MKTSNKILTGAYLVILLITIITMAFVRNGTSEKEPLKSIGEKTTKNVNFKYLRALNIAVGKVTLIQQEGPAHLEINCAENVRQHLVEKFEDDEFYLGMKHGENGDLDIAVIVYVPNIEAITISENARLVSNRIFKTNEINLTTKQSGSILMFIEAEMVNTFTFGGSNIYLSGTTKNLNAVVNNAGRVDALDLATDAVVANVGDAGKMNVTVISSLTANLSNAGKLSYKGEPTNIQKHGVVDAAELIKL
ncbi:MAG: head GIN domain-containing protein [Saprospiraceae bacterium]